jgi:hypothetical protein
VTTNSTAPWSRWGISTWVVGGIAALVLIITAFTGGIGGVLLTLSLFAFFSALYALTTGRKSWARIASRKVAGVIAGASIVLLFVGSGISASATDQVAASSASPTTQSSATPSATPKPSPKPKPVSYFSDEEPVDPESTVAADGQPSVVAASTTVTDGNAVALLATLPVKGKAPMTGYARTADFGVAWIDVDHNGCDTRNDILARDLTAVIRSGPCKVLSGDLASPYTGATIDFVRGNTTSTLVQIDHVVSLGNAWQTGAQQLTLAQRTTLANDPLNLLAVDGKSNEQKGDGDAATWLPSNKAIRCAYVSRQISVKATYGLWVTTAEHDAMARILASCPTQPATSSPFTPPPPAPVVVAAPVPAPAPRQVVAPAPLAPAPAAPAGVVHPGAFCSTAGAVGVTDKGTAMVCKTTATDARLRWRSA